ncbi:multidrug and toxin extrusion protein 1 [Stegastes partitus]|uniref:Multidrug and toxin extrusion protein n=1 Tax=Stegastes partitus TaxID=144197 RepID=A0A9Y4N9L1_9TELE|nr:PREDICTED: multidrug and toxin extrusion protein 1-like [Stegastes partitus]
MEKLGSPGPAHPLQGEGPVAGVSVAKTAGVVGDEEATLPSSKLFRCACVRRWLPLVYREELHEVLRLTGPLVLSRILSFLQQFVISIFCGHIGNAELAGYALAVATLHVTTIAPGYGLAVACDTLISQTYGGKNLKRVGVILQRSSLILLLFCVPCWGLLINSQNLLLVMHQEDEVARIAQLYVMMYLPAIPALFLHQLQVSYLQNQGIILPQMYTAAVANVLNLAFNYVLIFSLDLGVVGSAIANSLSQITICLLLFGYIRWKKLHRQTWGGCTTDSLQEWGSYMKLALPSALMICFEWWIWEVGGFLAGVLGEEDLAAQHIIAEVGAISYMFPFGIHAAACVRVGNALGAGDTERAKVTCKVALIMAGSFAVLQSIVIASTRSVMGYIFTSDSTIVEIASGGLTVYTFVQFFDALLCVSTGILIGSGMQKFAACINLVSYYCIGLPVGVALMFFANLRILGFWLGIIVCSSIQTCCFIGLIFKLNWKKITHKAQQRVGVKIAVTPKCSAGTSLNEAMLPVVSDSPDTAQLNSDGTSKTNVYSPVNTQDQERKVVHEAEGNNISTEGAERDSEQSKNTKPEKLLSTSQLILRRGFTLSLAVLALVVGIAFHIAFPPPEPRAQGWANFTQNFTSDFTPTPLILLNQNV